jgi:hypothetical protein
VAETCTSDLDSRCGDCNAGYYLQAGGPGAPDLCVLCPLPSGCVIAGCSSPGDATCSTCQSGYYLDGGTCQACAPVDHCDGTLSCGSATTSQCSSCADGYDLNETAPADTCDLSPTTDVRIAGNRARFSDLRSKISNLVISYDRDIDLMNLDPTVSGATLDIAGSAPGSSFSLEIPAADWKGPLPGRRFRVTKAGNPKIKIVMVSGRLLRISLQGSDAYPLGAPQGDVSVTLTIGTTRFCAKFGGTISKDDGTRFVARRAGKPDACPAVAPTPTPNQAPVARPNDYVTTETVVGLTVASGGYFVGNIRDDAPADSDPEGDAIAVTAVSNATLTIAGAPVVLTPVVGGIAAFDFTYAGKTGTFVISADGGTRLGAADGSLLTPLLTGEALVFGFDYTAKDVPGNTSNAAHVTVTINGEGEACFTFDGRRC